MNNPAGFDALEPDDMTLVIEAIMREMQLARRWATVSECLNALHRVRLMGEQFNTEIQRHSPRPGDECQKAPDLAAYQDLLNAAHESLAMSQERVRNSLQIIGVAETIATQADKVARAADEVRNGAKVQAICFNEIMECIASTASEYLPDTGPRAFIDVNAVVRYALHHQNQEIKRLQAVIDSMKVCRGCGKKLEDSNRTLADGCPCNTPRGVNHGLVDQQVCTCSVCDPKETGASRWRPEQKARDLNVEQQSRDAIARGEYTPLRERIDELKDAIKEDKCPHCDFVGKVCPTHERMGRVPLWALEHDEEWEVVPKPEGWTQERYDEIRPMRHKGVKK